MSFDRILGQNRALQIIRKSLQSGTCAPAYLFHGRESVGKKLAAVELAKSLNCAVSGPVDSCDQCASCRKIDQGIHPDFFPLRPTTSSASARESYIRIDAIRDLQRKLSFLPYEGRTKVAVIESAEQMNPQAGNAFLKTLEEPPKATVLVLIASTPYQLLPTIVSRCQGIMFNPLPPDAVKEILLRQETIDPGEIELRVSRSNGQIGRALDEDLLHAAKNREELLRLIDHVSFDRVDIVFQWAKAWAKKTDQIHGLLDELSNLLRDLALLKTHCQPNHILNNDLILSLKPLASGKKLSTLLKMFDSVLQTKFSLKSNLNTQLSLETMLLRFCDAA
ncbi:MAG: DNA polymerase III subunit delta' [Nitrospinales bacterium]